MNNGATVDAKQVLLMFAELDSRQQKKAHKMALRKATGILVNETKRNFRSVVKKPNSIKRLQKVKFILWGTSD